MDGGYKWLTDMEKQIENVPGGLDSVVELNSVTDNIIALSDPTFLSCEILFKSRGVEDFINEFKGRKFDLVIADAFCDCFYSLIGLFGEPPLVVATPYVEVAASNFIGLDENPTYVPFHMSYFDSRMSFVERFKNLFYSVLNSYAVRHYHVPISDRIAKDVLGPDALDLQYIFKNKVSLVLTGYDFVLRGAKPIPPNHIPISGFHVDPPKPIPQVTINFYLFFFLYTQFLYLRII